MTTPPTVLADLARVIHDRRDTDPARSYTAQLLEGGVEKIAAKVLEEANELVAAARAASGESGRAAVTHEAADLLYHTLVLLESRGVVLDSLLAELARRFGRSGIEEKASRGA